MGFHSCLTRFIEFFLGSLSRLPSFAAFFTGFYGPVPSFTEFSWGPWVVYLVLQRSLCIYTVL